jgi:hypothetical protein
MHDHSVYENSVYEYSVVSALLYLCIPQCMIIVCMSIEYMSIVCMSIVCMSTVWYLLCCTCASPNAWRASEKSSSCLIERTGTSDSVPAESSEKSSPGSAPPYSEWMVSVW